MTILTASEEVRARIRQARRERGWTIEDPRWLVEASQELEPVRPWAEVGPYANGVSQPTWRRFLRGRDPAKMPQQNPTALEQNATVGYFTARYSACNVSPAVRQEIEETLLLPIANIKKTW